MIDDEKPTRIMLNHSALIAEVEKALLNNLTLLALSGLCIAADTISQEYYLNMKVRKDLGFPFPGSINSDQIAKSKQHYAEIRKQGVGKIFCWAFENIEIDGAKRFNELQSSIFYNFRCNILHEINMDGISVNSEVRHDFYDLANKAKIDFRIPFEIEGEKSIVYPWRLFNIISHLIYPLNWASLYSGQQITKSLETNWISIDRFVEIASEA